MMYTNSIACKLSIPIHKVIHKRRIRVFKTNVNLFLKARIRVADAPQGHQDVVI